jgi:hypothetical protein
LGNCPELQRVRSPHETVCAVGRDDDVGFGRFRIRNLGAEAQVDTRRFRPIVEDLDQPPPRDPRKSLSAGLQDASAKMDLDIVPVNEGGLDRRVGHRIGGLNPIQRLVGEHDAPPKRVADPIPLENRDLDLRPRALKQGRKEKTRGTTTNTNDAQ